jgi:kynurenine formamidase
MLRLVDLTQTLRAGMRGVAWNTAATLEREGWNARILQLYSHAGTHMDAQAHFAAGRETIDCIPLMRCMGPAWLVDIPGLAPRALITVEHLREVPQLFRPGDSLLLRTGWSQFVDEPSIYRDGLPRIGEDLALWCANNSVKILGVEPPSVADVNNLEEVTCIHKILLTAGVVIVEGLAHLESISSRRVHFTALPLKIDGGDGSPCRAFALEGSEARTDDPAPIISE